MGNIIFGGSLFLSHLFLPLHFCSYCCSRASFFCCQSLPSQTSCCIFVILLSKGTRLGILMLSNIYTAAGFWSMHPVSGASPTKLEVWAILGSKDMAGGGRAVTPLPRSNSLKRRVRFSPEAPDSCPEILPPHAPTCIGPLRSSSPFAMPRGC